ncbi:RES family NAD+ phosphorylase [Paraburkholderia phosphatilytica]|uniref:RES family NAD+ phosphorylase n=1 Tax=Paraburkholderia phosphatilytica TaxID=2282883 RepID=UPI0030B81521
MSAYEPQLLDDWHVLERDPVSTVRITQGWLERGEQFVMRVPSVVCHADSNLVLNTRHRAMQKVRVVENEPFAMDFRFSDGPCLMRCFSRQVSNRPDE